MTAQLLYNAGISASEVYKCLQAGRNELDQQSEKQQQESQRFKARDSPSKGELLYNADFTPSEVYRILGKQTDLDSD